MLLPGLMCDAAVWAPQVAALQSQAHCVVPAYGLRDSLTQMAQQVLELVPTERFSMAGHSMGGRVALEVMRLAPQRVERLALLDTGTHPLAQLHVQLAHLAIDLGAHVHLELGLQQA